MKIRFLEDAEVRDAAGAVVESYRAGAAHDLRPDKARHWLKRGKAEPASDAAPAKADADPVEIPADWPALPWGKRRALAESIAGRRVATAGEARKIIDDELAKRAGDQLERLMNLGDTGGAISFKAKAPESEEGGFSAAQDAHRDAALKADD